MINNPMILLVLFSMVFYLGIEAGKTIGYKKGYKVAEDTYSKLRGIDGSFNKIKERNLKKLAGIIDIEGN